MKCKDKGKYEDKDPADRKSDPVAVQSVREKAPLGVIPCAVAFGIVSETGASAKDVGFTIDKLEIRISKCQLGLFGNTPIGKIVRPMENVPEDLARAIREALVNNRLSCLATWEIAKRFRMPKIRISAACESMEIKIESCQLGAF